MSVQTVDLANSPPGRPTDDLFSGAEFLFEKPCEGTLMKHADCSTAAGHGDSSSVVCLCVYREGWCRPFALVARKSLDVGAPARHT